MAVPFSDDKPGSFEARKEKPGILKVLRKKPSSEKIKGKKFIVCYLSFYSPYQVALFSCQCLLFLFGIGFFNSFLSLVFLSMFFSYSTEDSPSVYLYYDVISILRYVVYFLLLWFSSHFFLIF